MTTLLPTRTERMLEKSGRITPREVLAAYEQTGERPVFGEFGLGQDKGACEIEVIGLASGIGINPYRLRMLRGLKPGYIWGVYSGYDGEPNGFARGSEESKGWNDGRRARVAVLSRYPEAAA